MDLKLEEASLGIEVLNPRQAIFFRRFWPCEWRSRNFRLVPILVFILCCLGENRRFLQWYVTGGWVEDEVQIKSFSK